MSASSQIGDVTDILLKNSDAYGNNYSTNISKGFKVNPVATYQQVDSAIRAVNGLTTHSYDDTVLITQISVNNEMSK